MYIHHTQDIKCICNCSMVGSLYRLYDAVWLLG